MSVLRAIENRRSNYVIGPVSDIAQPDIEHIVAHCIKHTPSMFNMQSTRAIILYEHHHAQLWDLILDSLGDETLNKRPNVAAIHFDTVREKIDTLRSGHGTILFFEDNDVVSETLDRYPAYSKSFRTWSLQSSGIAQYAVWLALTEASPNLGVTLQHYFPNRVRMGQIWDIPEHWEMTGQMPFGHVMQRPAEKKFLQTDQLVRSFGSAYSVI